MSAKHQPIEAQIAELRRELLDHDLCNQPVVSDADYDALLRRLKELEAERLCQVEGNELGCLPNSGTIPHCYMEIERQ